METLESKVRRSLAVIRYAQQRSAHPLIVNFSGGKDSLVLFDLIQQVTDDFLCMYCVSGIEFPEVIEDVKRTAEERGVDLYFSYPSDHKGGFFERLAEFRAFPTIHSRWCSRDLKFRPQKKLLNRLFGNSVLYKLNAVRRYESSRRRRIYAHRSYMAEDPDVSGDIMVFPIMDWTTEERNQYLKERAVKVETSSLYESFGVSGCYWCPFYQPSIYRWILMYDSTMYDRFIEWEIALNSPSVNGYTWLRDLKKEVEEEEAILVGTQRV